MPEAMLASGPDAAETCWTTREIGQQPETLGATQALLEARADELAAFVGPLLARPELRVIFTGAGTSAFIGESLAPWLTARLGRTVEAIATTDIVSTPHLHLLPDAPTLLVSFGRSGNSPESLAAVALVDRMVEEVHHLIITCNADGALAARTGADVQLVVLPEATHDRGFAMTSSFSAMMLAAASILGGVAEMGARVPAIAAGVADMLAKGDPVARDLAGRGFDRVVYLGSGLFKGLAREAALKLMELSDGAVVTAFDTPMGFRHGPKTIVTPRTLIVVFVSNDPLTSRYDRDILAELIADGRCGAVVAVSARAEPGDALSVAGMRDCADMDLLFPYIVPAQLIGLHVSVALGLTPDRPNRNGTVNRVVQGVRIHQ